MEWCDPCRDDGEKLHPRSFQPEEVQSLALSAPQRRMLLGIALHGAPGQALL